MRNLLYLIFILTFPILLFSQDTITSQNIISYRSSIIIESNSLNIDFGNRLFFGGYIKNSQKSDWISKLDEKNILFSEISNKISFSKEFNKNTILLSLTDRNLARMSFTDDLMKIILLGNYNFQDETINFNNTNFTLNRFQQIKFGYERTFNVNQNDLIFKTAFSYLNGNHHLSFVSEKGSFYTASYGLYNELEYDIDAFATDTSNFNFFENNGNGTTFDFLVSYKTSDKKFTIYLSDLGYINWKESAFKYFTDTSFSFYGIVIDDLLEFNDSIIDAESDKFLEDIYINAKKGRKKSYIPADFGFSIELLLQDNFFKKYTTGINLRWQPHRDNNNLSIDKVLQGYFESDYSPYFYIRAFKEIKYFLIMPQIAIGGYTKKFSLGITTIIGKKLPLQIGLNHLENIFKGNQSQALSVYLQISKGF